MYHFVPVFFEYLCSGNYGVKYINHKGCKVMAQRSQGILILIAIIFAFNLFFSFLCTYKPLI